MTLITKDGTYYYVAYNEGVVLLLQTELCNLQRNGEQKKKSIINQIMLTGIVSDGHHSPNVARGHCWPSKS